MGLAFGVLLAVSPGNRDGVAIRGFQIAQDIHFAQALYIVFLWVVNLYM